MTSNLDAYGTKPPSPREVVAHQIATHIRELGLINPYGGEAKRHSTNRFWEIGFSFPRYLDGTVAVFSEKYIRITWHTQYRNLPERADRNFDNAEFACLFLTMAFKDHNAEEAMRIPVWVGKRQQKAQQADSAPTSSAPSIPPSFDPDFFTAPGGPDEPDSA